MEPLFYLTLCMSMIQKDIDRINSNVSKLEDVARKSVMKNAEIILELIKNEQLGKGIMSDGSSAPLYSPVTDQIANSPFGGNRPRKDKVAGQPWNFEWSGDWMDAFYIRSQLDGFDILSSDGKTRMLEEKAGGKLLKLTEKLNDFINETIIQPDLYKFMLDSLLS